MKSRKRIRRDLGPRMRDCRQQRGLAGIRISHQPHIGNDPQLEKVITFAPWLTGLREARCLPGCRGKISVPQAPAAAFAQNELLPMLREISNHLTLSLHCILRFRLLG